MAGDGATDDPQRRDGANQVCAGMRRDGVDRSHVGRVDHGDGEIAGLVGGDREHRMLLGELGGDAQQGVRIDGVEHRCTDPGDHQLAVQEVDDAVLVDRAELEQRLDERELALGAPGLHGSELIVGEQASPHHHGSEETQAPTMIHRRSRAVNGGTAARGRIAASSGGSASSPHGLCGGWWP